MFDTTTVEEALDAYDLYERSPNLLVGDNLWVYGSQAALARAQMYIIAKAAFPVERRDTCLYLANELKISEDKVKKLREEVAALQEQLVAYKRHNGKSR